MQNWVISKKNRLSFLCMSLIEVYGFERRMIERLVIKSPINQWLILSLCSETSWAAVEDVERSDAVPCLWGIYNLAVDTRWPVLKTRREQFNAKLWATRTGNHISEKGDFRIKARVVWEVFMKSLRLGSNVLADFISVHKRIRRSRNILSKGNDEDWRRKWISWNMLSVRGNKVR